MNPDDIIEVDGTKPGEGGEVVIEHPSLLAPEVPVTKDPHALKPFSDELIHHVEEINSDYQDSELEPFNSETSINLHSGAYEADQEMYKTVVSDAMATGVIQDLSTQINHANMGSTPSTNNSPTQVSPEPYPSQNTITNRISTDEIPPMPPQPK